MSFLQLLTDKLSDRYEVNGLLHASFFNNFMYLIFH